MIKFLVNRHPEAVFHHKSRSVQLQYVSEERAYLCIIQRCLL